MTALSRRTLLLSLAAGSLLAACRASTKLGPMMAPSALAQRIDDVKSGKLAVLYVGPDLMFQLGHIPGARNIGPVGEDDGYAAVERALRELPADVEAVLYCGCCPVASCPNVGPASELIAKLGRQRTYLLDLPTRFADDWTDKGYPVETR